MELLAPGESIVSLKTGGGLSAKNGTSSAAALVAGVVAQILQYDRQTIKASNPQKKNGLIHDVATMLHILRRMTPGAHTPDRGHGVIRPERLVPYGPKACYRGLFC